MNHVRTFYLLLFLACLVLLGYGYYLQFVQGQEPCPLCIFQRVAYIAVAVFALIGFLHGAKNKWSRLYSALIFLSAMTGSLIAGRQVWLQHLPADQVPECGPGLDYMLEIFPLSETIKMVFTGSGECAEVGWTFLSLSIAEWSLICFILLTITSLIHSCRGYLFNTKLI